MLLLCPEALITDRFPGIGGWPCRLFRLTLISGPAGWQSMGREGEEVVSWSHWHLSVGPCRGYLARRGGLTYGSDCPMEGLCQPCVSLSRVMSPPLLPCRETRPRFGLSVVCGLGFLSHNGSSNHLTRPSRYQCRAGSPEMLEMLCNSAPDSVGGSFWHLTFLPNITCY